MVDVRCVESEKGELLAALGTSEKGLSSEEANKRLEVYGPNIIAKHEKPNLLKMFFSQFLSPLVGLLFLAALLSFAIGEANESIIILAVVFLNAFIGTYHERQAAASMEALRKLTKENTKTYRDGELTIIPSEHLVPGDVVLLTEGDKVPADARVLHVKGFKVNESTLTGEPISVPKSPDPTSGTSIDKMSNIVFAGTLVVSGEALAVVCSTGKNTVLGSVYSRLSQSGEFPAKEKLKAFSKSLFKAVALGFVAILLLGMYIRMELVEVFNLAVAQAVSFIPEGLPIVVTVALAVSAYDMAKKKAVIRKLEAIEAIGQIDVLCVDKTGTITKNSLVLASVAMDGDLFSLEDGKVLKDKEVLDLAEFPHLLEVLEMAALSSIVKGKEYNIGDPLDVALIKSISNLSLAVNPPALFSVYELIEESPFDFKSKTTCRRYRRDGKEFVIKKGSPENLINIATHFLKKGEVRPISTKDRALLSSHLEELASKGYRVVALLKEEGNKKVFLAFLCFWDEIREDARPSIQKLKNAGIKVLMITGDHKLTAKAVAKKVGLGSRVLDQEELFSMSENNMLKALRNLAAVSRATIEGKLRIISLLQKEGRVVAMTGDGVNDAAALRKAHVGISLGSGTDVAKEASDIVVLDDSIRSIAEATEEGRRSITNIIKTVRYLLTTNITEVVFLFSSLIGDALAAGISYPLRAMHILYVNLVTDGLCDVAIATEGKEEELAKKPPSFFQRGYSTPDMAFFIAVGAATSLLVLLAVSFIYAGRETLTSAVLTALVFIQLWIALSSRKLSLSLDLKNKFLLISITIALLIHFAALYYPPLSDFMGLQPLPLEELVLLAVLASSVFITLELFKILLPLLRLIYP